MCLCILLDLSSAAPCQLAVCHMCYSLNVSLVQKPPDPGKSIRGNME